MDRDDKNMQKELQNIISAMDSARGKLIDIQMNLAEKKLPQDKKIGTQIYELTELTNQVLEMINRMLL